MEEHEIIKTPRRLERDMLLSWAKSDKMRDFVLAQFGPIVGDEIDIEVSFSLEIRARKVEIENNIRWIMAVNQFKHRISYQLEKVSRGLEEQIKHMLVE